VGSAHVPENPERFYFTRLFINLPKKTFFVFLLAQFFFFIEAVLQLLLALKISLLFGFKALFAFFFLPILDCWTAS